MHRFKTLRALLTLISLAQAGAQALFINEIHYDNAGSDVGEGIEIAGTAGTDLAGFTLLFYNGSTGTVYRDVGLTGLLADQSDGYGTAFFAVTGLQNGAPDGVALIDPAGLVVQFLSYEGSFTASDGAAAGVTSTDIGLFEDGTGAPGTSLQLTGSGTAYGDFAWVIAAASYGSVNDGQSFTPVPLPASLPLLAAAAAAALAGLGRRSAG